MPTYQYQCKECGVIFERFQHFSENPLKLCPECNGPVFRVIQPVGIIFKGKGFYVTDHRSGNSPATAPPKSEKPSGTSEKAEPKPEAKESKAGKEDGQS